MFYVIEEQFVSRNKGYAIKNYAYVVESPEEINYRVVHESMKYFTSSIVIARCLNLKSAQNVARRVAYTISFGADNAINAGVRYDGTFRRMIRPNVVAGPYMAGERPEIGWLEIDDELSGIIFECGRSNEFYDNVFVISRLANYVTSEYGMYVSSDSIVSHIKYKYLETKDSSGFDTISEFLRIEHQWDGVLANAMQEMVESKIDWAELLQKQHETE